MTVLSYLLSVNYSTHILINKVCFFLLFSQFVHNFNEKVRFFIQKFVFYVYALLYNFDCYLIIQRTFVVKLKKAKWPGSFYLNHKPSYFIHLVSLCIKLFIIFRRFFLHQFKTS